MPPHKDYTDHGEVVVPGEITGYRAWYPGVDTRREGRRLPHLRALAREVAWTLGVNVAHCINGMSRHSIGGISMYSPLQAPHPAPHRTCSCGFYARTDDMNHGYQHGFQGIIKASGRVVLGRKGFRAEKARVVGLFVTSEATRFWGRHSWGANYTTAWATDYPEAMSLLAEYYGVPIFRDFEEAKEAFPPDDLSALRTYPGVQPEDAVEPTVGPAVRVQLFGSGPAVTGSLGGGVYTIPNPSPDWLKFWLGPQQP